MSAHSQMAEYAGDHCASCGKAFDPPDLDWSAMNGNHADYLRVQRSGPNWEVWDTYGQKAGQAVCIGSDPIFAYAVKIACSFLEKDGNDD